MKLLTERLELVPLQVEDLRLWTEDTQELEKRLNCKCAAEPMEGFFLEIVRQQLAICEKHPQDYLWHSFWLIIRQSDRTVVGSADFKDIPNADNQSEIGYGLGSQFEHCGYMTETVKAMCHWAQEQVPGIVVIAETENQNLPSQHILQRCGFVKWKTAETTWWQLPPRH